MNLLLLDYSELSLRLEKVRAEMTKVSLDAILISDYANLYYLTGRVFSGYVYIPAQGMPLYFVKRPVNLSGDGVVEIRKPEDIPASLGLNIPPSVGLEADVTSYSAVERLKALFPEAKIGNASAVMRCARAVKTRAEIFMMEMSGRKQAFVYSQIPSLYKEGMTDLELQIEIERKSRLEGCLGQFRISGDTMELYMGNVLAGENADTPTPYDFAMGGAGIDPSLPVGCDGSVIKPHTSVMVDVNGNYTGYMTDMTRTFSLGTLSELAMKAHECSVKICHTLESLALPGVEAKSLYDTVREIAVSYGLETYFMGHRQKAGFVGHGVGIEINELPVIAPRSKDILQEGNTIALEPKFVIPHVGAVGIENTYEVTGHGLRKLTSAPEEIVEL